MSKFIFATICTASFVFAATGVAHSEPSSSTQQSGGASNSHSQDDPKHAQHQGEHGVTSHSAQSNAGANGNTQEGSAPAEGNRDEQVEGASSGSTATSSGDAANTSNGNQRRSQSPSGGGVVHPKEP